MNYSSATKLCLLSFPRGTFVLFLVAKLTNFFPLLEKNLSHFLRKSEIVCAERIFECASVSVGAGRCMFEKARESESERERERETERMRFQVPPTAQQCFVTIKSLLVLRMDAVEAKLVKQTKLTSKVAFDELFVIF